jgi:hypothetical protein
VEDDFYNKLEKLNVQAGKRDKIGKKVSAIDVTSKTICERLYLVAVLGKFGP